MTTYKGTATGNALFSSNGFTFGGTIVEDITDILTIDGSGDFTGTQEVVATATVAGVTSAPVDSGKQPISGNIHNVNPQTFPALGGSVTVSMVFVDPNHIQYSGQGSINYSGVIGTINYSGTIANTASDPLFTTNPAGDTVDFNNLSDANKAAIIAKPISKYDGLGGSDNVNLPSEANETQDIGGGEKLGWHDSVNSLFHTKLESWPGLPSHRFRWQLLRPSRRRQ